MKRLYAYVKYDQLDKLLLRFVIRKNVCYIVRSCAGKIVLHLYHRTSWYFPGNYLLFVLLEASLLVITFHWTRGGA